MTSLRRSHRKKIPIDRYKPELRSKQVGQKYTHGGDDNINTGYLLALNFITYQTKRDEEQTCDIVIELEFDATGKVMPASLYQNKKLDEMCKIMLINRGSNRLALNTRNPKFKHSRTELSSVALFIPAGGSITSKNWELKGTVKLEEVRQTSAAEGITAAVKGIGATMFAPVGALLGTAYGAVKGALKGGKKGVDMATAAMMHPGMTPQQEVGAHMAGGMLGIVPGAVTAPVGAVVGAAKGASAGARASFDAMFADEYLTADSKSLLSPTTRSAAAESSSETLHVDVPFQIVIADLSFEGIWSEPRTLVIKGIFKRVRVGREQYRENDYNRRQDKINVPAEVHTMDIQQVTLLKNDPSGNVKKSSLKRCIKDSNCLYFKSTTV